MKKLARNTLCSALACLASAASYAATVQINETGLINGLATNGLVLPVQAGAANYWAGLQSIVINNTSSFLAFCADPWEWSPSTNQNYSTGSIDNAFGTTKANYIRELYSESYASTLKINNGGANAAAAFQLALWEIIADGDLHLDNLGLVQTTSNTTQNLVAQANAMLGQINGQFGSENYSLTFYANGKSGGVGNTAGFQDYLVANKIPEPGTGLLMSAALCSAGLFSLRRRKARQQG